LHFYPLAARQALSGWERLTERQKHGIGSLREGRRILLSISLRGFVPGQLIWLTARELGTYLAGSGAPAHYSTSILLEYEAERFFEAGEGAKAV
jgi:hypothetical protein